MRRRLAIVFLFVAAGCGSTGSEATEVAAPAPPTSVEESPTQVTTNAGAQTLASGELAIPAANAFGDPGFHEVLTATAALDLPEGAGSTEGLRLVLALRDAGRPDQSCASEHPLSGCATVDWSDFEDRPNVPPGGVFDNHVTLETAAGPRTFYVSESGALADEPDPYKDG